MQVELTEAQRRAIPYLFAADATELRSVEQLLDEGIVIVPLAEHLREFVGREPAEDEETAVIVLSDEGREWAVVTSDGEVTL